MATNLTPESIEYLANLRTNPAFMRLLDELDDRWAPKGSPKWTPENRIKTKDRIFYEARQDGFNTLTSYLRGN